jgi:hypothetical protein
MIGRGPQRKHAMAHHRALAEAGEVEAVRIRAEARWSGERDGHADH